MRSSWPALGWRLRPFFQVLWKRVSLKFDPDLGLQDQVDLHGSLWEALEFLSVILGEIIFRRNHKNSRAFLSLLLAVIVACTFMKYILTTRELQEEEQDTASMLSFSSWSIVSILCETVLLFRFWNKFFWIFQNVQKASMTTILEAGMHCNSAKMASSSEVVKSEVNYDTVRTTVRDTIR